jgi:hypothetical protein
MMDKVQKHNSFKNFINNGVSYTLFYIITQNASISVITMTFLGLRTYKLFKSKGSFSP